MNRYIVFDLEDIEPTKYDYKIGDSITVNSSCQYKCMGMTTKNGNAYYLFNVGVPRYEYKEITQTEINDFINSIKWCFYYVLKGWDYEVIFCWI